MEGTQAFNDLPQTHVIIQERKTYKPAWQPEFTQEQLEQEVTQNGEGLGFRVGDMLVERRWTTCKVERTEFGEKLTPSGELMDQRDFEVYYKRFKMLSVQGQNLIDIKTVNKYWEDGLMPVPLVRKYADAKPDMNGYDVPINFDPHAKPEKESNLRYDYEGNLMEERRNESELLIKIKQLEELRRDGTIDDGTFSFKMSALLTSDEGMDVPVVDEPKRPEGFQVAKKRGPGRPKKTE